MIFQVTTRFTRRKNRTYNKFIFFYNYGLLLVPIKFNLTLNYVFKLIVFLLSLQLTLVYFYTITSPSSIIHISTVCI